MKFKFFRTLKIALLVLPVSMFFFFKEEPMMNTLPQPESTSKLDLPDKPNDAFKAGEVLTYRLHYGAIDAGAAVLEVQPQIQEISGRKVYHIVGNGYSKGTFNWFFKVKDRYETYMDKDAMVPWYFVRRCNEGGYIINQDYLFNHFTKKVDIGGGQKCDVPEGIQDMLSAFYYARNLDLSGAKEGDIFSVSSFVDKETFKLKIKFVGRETIDSDVGKFRCLVFRPIIQTGRIFKKEEDLNVWITDDKNHIVVRAQAKILVGSIKMDLMSFQNLANPVSKVQ
ncbi:MAG: DUF3108 domain-containing protein [Bacteroidia bacterium]